MFAVLIFRVFWVYKLYTFIAPDYRKYRNDVKCYNILCQSNKLKLSSCVILTTIKKLGRYNTTLTTENKIFVINTVLQTRRTFSLTFFMKSWLRSLSFSFPLRYILINAICLQFWQSDVHRL